jgi:hypothetical protein
LGAFEAKLLHIELTNEGINHSTHVIGRNEIVQYDRE